MSFTWLSRGPVSRGRDVNGGVCTSRGSIWKQRARRGRPLVTWHCIIKMSAFWDLDVKRVRENVHGNGVNAWPSLL